MELINSKRSLNELEGELRSLKYQVEPEDQEVEVLRMELINSKRSLYELEVELRSLKCQVEVGLLVFIPS
ncbi:hypothetical protein JB92DRAFT_2865609 [Gautieria morchelliformis]|nr:hypothetical protein JB92DRAFT_2865609 [Gautieria morchelliformis]